MIGLFDADLFPYRIGYTVEDLEEGEEWIIDSRLNGAIDEVIDTLDLQACKFYLTSEDKSNFRYEVYPEYKGNRTQPKPKFYRYIRDYLLNAYDAEMVFGMEADDALGINQTEDTIIISIDKDLLIVPGWHYNFVKKEKHFVTPKEGCYNFYWQLLEGDKGTDNIPGCPGIGKGTIPKVIHSDMEEDELFYIVKNLYINQYTKKKLDVEQALPDMLRNGQLLKIKTKASEGLWQFPNQLQSVV